MIERRSNTDYNIEDVYNMSKEENEYSIKNMIKLEYKIGFDTTGQRITIPIYDIYGNLSDIKGRATREQHMDCKFFFLYNKDSSKILFNYFKAKKYCYKN